MAGAMDRDSVIDYLESLSPDSEVLRHAHVHLSNGDSSASKVTPIGNSFRQPPINELSNSIAMVGGNKEQTSHE